MPRPPKEINPAQVRKLAEIGATATEIADFFEVDRATSEIADFFEVDRATIHRRFAAEISKGRAQLHMRLRRLQLRAAGRGSAAMLIWLGKTMLRQGEAESEQDAEFTVVIHTGCDCVPEDPTAGHCHHRPVSIGDP